MGRREWLALAGLACCAFVMNTSEFMPIGLLVDIAADFAMTEAEAGAVVTIYAWAVALLSIPLMVALSRMSPTRLLLGVIALFCAGQIASAAAPTFTLLVAGRLLVAAAHAVFWSVVSPVAVRIVGASTAAPPSRPSPWARRSPWCAACRSGASSGSPSAGA